ncbi:DUF4360 domain-containing protein [Goodfellowiella coeruleoviolacea]|uniref:DUF4360 domain-containing protein n=1 Tax=Goodfellowiella coeruleoviolacea TaxID=334858 RepID=A0AAE3GFF3_9PSEU|nr:DUF4360 domain-containing protein [Goodfellowiella coeruleoviolacea]MCP2166374.1 protein of unknown function (DUF4360) [Goodfellowiella coeruleoviolacea]
MLTAIAAVGTAMALVTSPAPVEQSDVPPPGKIVIDVLTVNGSGCRAGSAAVAPAPDNTAFTVTYSEYTAVAGGNSDPTDFRKNCQISMLVHIPQGFTYAVSKADYRGFAHLASGATGLQKASYYVQGVSETSSVSHPLTGPYSDNWQTTDEKDEAKLVYAPCGEDTVFNVNTELRVNAGLAHPDQTSFVTMDSTDGSVRSTYHFEWKQCAS